MPLAPQAAIYGIGAGDYSKIVHYQTWKHIVDPSDDEEWYVDGVRTTRRACLQSRQRVSVFDSPGPNRAAAGERNRHAKLTADQVREIRQRYIPGVVTTIQLAAEYGVSDGQISKIILREAWGHID